MKKSSRFLVGFAAAALTFGSLFAILGPDKFAHCSHHWKNHPCESHHGCGDHHNYGCHNDNDTLR